MVGYFSIDCFFFISQAETLSMKVGGGAYFGGEGLPSTQLYHHRSPAVTQLKPSYSPTIQPSMPIHPLPVLPLCKTWKYDKGCDNDRG